VSSDSIEICAGADETFFAQPILLLDLASGYIFVEATSNQRYETLEKKSADCLWLLRECSVDFGGDAAKQ